MRKKQNVHRPVGAEPSWFLSRKGFEGKHGRGEEAIEIGRIGRLHGQGPKAAAELIGYLSNPSPIVKAKCLKALAALNAVEAAESVAPLLLSGSEFVRAEAARTLGVFRHAGSFLQLIARTNPEKESHPLVRRAAWDALVDMPGKDISATLGLRLSQETDSQIAEFLRQRISARKGLH
ncbi:MAG: HEAT repeat domain-containing protein [Candidatus Diapherotrites archaeon]|uniref:HEAT repeat domain-containing protein n=1 Tax=Candidatus Iainarchaeum sp. TaxID=3101447 RepID=A0A8T3YLM1_9ARCH|nr:HEAT repeat domain-containing protein [Candidatus Diapherotrites archaeon]